MAGENKNDTSALTLEFNIHFKKKNKGRKCIENGSAQIPPRLMPGKIPRISRLMALAIRYDKLIREGKLKDFAQLAKLGQVSRARVSQISNLLNLAPDIQEELLFLGRTVSGKDTITERHMRPILSNLSWNEQRKMWKELKEQVMNND